MLVLYENRVVFVHLGHFSPDDVHVIETAGRDVAIVSPKAANFVNQQ